MYENEIINWKSGNDLMKMKGISWELSQYLRDEFGRGETGRILQVKPKSRILLKSSVPAKRSHSLHEKRKTALLVQGD